MVGDLLEEVRSGRSRWWLVREVIASSAGALGRRIAANRLSSLGAVLCGLLVTMPLSALLRQVPYSGTAFFVAANCVIFSIAGAAIAYKFPKDRAAMAAVFTTYAIFAKAALLVFNYRRLISPAHPWQLASDGLALMVPPLCATLAAILIESRYTRAASD
jgi:hypothetical protein